MRGESKSTLDAKGRMNFPAKLREEFGDSFVIVRALKVPCIQVFSAQDWESFEKNLLNNHPKTKAEQILRFCGASNADMDKQGRFFVPAHLREYANLDTDVIVNRLYEKKAEIWSKDAWDENMGKIDIDSLVDEMDL
jgi:MraZ protein